jgi:hypothetical protein
MSRLRRIAFGSTGLAVVAVTVAFTASPQTSAGVSATFGDGSVRFVRDQLGLVSGIERSMSPVQTGSVPSTYRAMGSRSGGEVISSD